METPNGTKSKLFISTDKNQKTIRRERDVKKVHRVIENMFPKRTTFNKKEGVVFVDWKRVVRVDPQPGPRENSKLYFHYANVSEIKLEKALVLQAFGEVAAASDKDQWEL